MHGDGAVNVSRLRSPFRGGAGEKGMEQTMRRKIHVILLAAAAFSALSACGRALSDAIGYTHNTAPSILSFSAVNADGSSIDPSKVAAKRVYILTVSASDPDNQKLVYSFRSPSGTFREQTDTPAGCTVKFVVGVVKGGDKVCVQALVRDSRGSVTGQTLDLGTGKLGPSISAVTDTSLIRSTGDVKVAVSSNCAGSFQLVPSAVNAEESDSPSSIDRGQYVLSYTAGAESVAALLTGPNSSTAGSAQLPSSSGGYPDGTFYNTWVVFSDALGQCDSVPVRVTVDDQSPSVTGTVPADGQDSVGSSSVSVRVSFSEDVDEATLAGALSLEKGAVAAKPGAVSFTSYSAESNTADFTVTDLSKNTKYTAEVSGVSDLAGNTMAPRQIVFYTTAGCAVTYDGNGSGGGNVPSVPTTYRNGDSVTVLGNTAAEPLFRTGYSFTGWNTSADGNGTPYAAGDVFVMGEDDVTLYAQWTMNDYTVTLHFNDGSAERQMIVTHGSKLDEPAVDERTGWTFHGWYSDAAYTKIWTFGTDTVTSNLDLYAKWTFDSCTVTFNANGGSAAPAAQTLWYGALVDDPGAPGTRDRYTFGWWCSDENLTSRWTFATDTVSGDLTLYAKWIPVPVTGVTLDRSTVGFSGTQSSCTLTATISPSNALNTVVNWTTSNEDVATVEGGVVTPRSGGSATITATTSDGGHTAICTVHVAGAGSVPGNLSLHGLSTESTSLTPVWNLPTDDFFDHVLVECEKTDDGSAVSVPTVGASDSTCTIGNLSDGTDYTITIKAFDGGGVVYDTETVYVTALAGRNYELISSLDTALMNLPANLSKNYLLTADVALTGAWQPLGTGNAPFSGIFNGNGHTISGLTVNSSSSSDPGGFFGFVSGARIQNLTIIDAEVTVKAPKTGALAGSAASSVISRCAVSGTVTATTVLSYVGGLAGYSTNTVIRNCVSGCTVEASGGENVGGLFGYAESGTVTGCSSSGSVTGSKTVGGFAGMSSCPITNCAFSGAAVTGSSSWVGGFVGKSTHDITGCEIISESLTVAGYDYVGGFAGKTLNWWNANSQCVKATLSNCKVSTAASVVGTEKKVGGFAGDNCATISLCSTKASANSTYSTSLAGESDNRVGGFVGWNQSGSIISQCYAVGMASGKERVGGFAGLNEGTIEDCYAKGSAEAYYRAGGFVGDHSAGSLKCCYAAGALIKTSGSSGTEFGGFTGCADDSAEVTACYYKDTNYATTGTPLSSYDFETSGFRSAVWGINESLYGPYPYLLNNLPPSP